MPPSLAGGDVRRLRMARERFLSDAGAAQDLRPVVQRSWSRSTQFGVPPGRRWLDVMAPPRLEMMVRQAADPVLDALGEQIGELPAVVLLTDAAGVIAEVRGGADVRRFLDRVQAVPSAVLSEEVTGTNAVGTAIEEGRGVQLHASEHFIEAFQGLACTAIPLRHPFTRRLLAVLDLTTRARDLTPAVARIVVEAAHAIERALYERLTARERALLEQYLREARRGRDAVLATDGQTIIANAAAARALDQADYAALWLHAEHGLRDARAAEHLLTLASGHQVRLALTPRYDGGEPVGVVMRLDPVPFAPAAAPLARPADSFAGLAGHNPRFCHALQLARDAVSAGLPVCIAGDPGTGKYALARALAGTAGGQAATVECAAAIGRLRAWLGEVRRALETGSIIIFRHSDALSPVAQRALAALLETVADGSSRVIATVQDEMPEELDRTRHIRRELLDRLAAVQVRMPALAERRDDIPHLARALLDRAAPGRRIMLSGEALRALMRADWPGNVRQLDHALRAALARARGPAITLADLPETVVATEHHPGLSPLEAAEIQALRRALRETGGNRRQAAARLGISRSTLYRKLGGYHLSGLALED